MRYFIKEKDYTKSGTKRIVKRFALLPMSGNWFSNERRWLETLYLEQHYHISDYGFCNCWMSDRFVEKADYLKYKK